MTHLSKKETNTLLKIFVKTDNYTNIFYIVRAWIVIFVTIGIAIYTYQFYSQYYFLGIYALSLLLLGACLHQLAGLGHEGSHYTLFKNNLLNELASDFFCMYPIFTDTQNYRSHHLDHHRYVNDPLKDPDIVQLQKSGHVFSIPMERKKAFSALARLISPVNLIRYINGRSPEEQLPETDVTYKIIKPFRLATLLATIAPNIYPGRLWLWLLPLVILGVALLIAQKSTIPAANRNKAAYTEKQSLQLRIFYTYLLLTLFAVLCSYFGAIVYLYCLLFWIVPLLTTFPLFMSFRQIIQHSNRDDGFFTNTTVMLFSLPIRFALFPIGQDYHLPHHMYPSVPHYLLKPLHIKLMAYSDYSKEVDIIENVLFRNRDCGTKTLYNMLIS